VTVGHVALQQEFLDTKLDPLSAAASVFFVDTACKSRLNSRIPSHFQTFENRSILTAQGICWPT
jgi:hypothetical protein